jgi:glycosyltransferase involved in cell wall biosynthesis
MSLLFSAYVPCYNNAATLRRAVESVLAQTIAPAEMLVVDDGSTDDSVAQLSGLPIRIVRQERNLGRGAARARAMAEARHELVLSCDAGMALATDFAARALPWFEQPEVAAVFGRIQQPPARTAALRWRARHLYKIRPDARVRHRVALATGGTILRRSAAAAAGGFDPRLRHSEDFDLGARLLATGRDVVCDPALVMISLTHDRMADVLERYWRWHAGKDEVAAWRDYGRNIAYALKVMIADDLRAGDPGAAFISAICPHYQFWKSRRRARRRGEASR